MPNRIFEVEVDPEWSDLFLTDLNFMNGVVRVTDMEPYVPPVRSK